MDSLELLKTRRSIRKYIEDKEVEKEKIDKCLEAARWAPSASNKQPWQFLIVTDIKKREKLAELHPYAKFVKMSPVVFIPLSDPEIHPKYHHADTALATMQFLIEAHAQGLGTCWAGAIDTPFEKDIKELLGIPDKLKVVALVAVGYSAFESPPKKTRKDLEDLVHYEKF